MSLTFLALLACSGGKDGNPYFSGDWACEHEPWDWYSDPVQYLLEADEDGEFDFDPPGEVVTGRKGTYDYDSGDFEWESEFVEGYYGAEGLVEGYGTIYDDGDLDVLYRSVFTDVLGDSSHSRVRAERDGCTAVVKTWSIDADAALEDTPSADPFEWIYEIVDDDEVRRDAAWSEDGEDWVATGTMTDDLVSRLHYETLSGSLIYDSTSYGDGTATATQEAHDGDYDIYWNLDDYLDGSRDIAMEAYEAGSSDLVQQCAYGVTYEGVGSGECTFYQGGDSLTCELSFDQDSCTYDCEDGNEYDCS